MKQQLEPELQILLTDLKFCAIKRSLQWGRRIHARAVEARDDSDMYVATALIKMYAKCGSMVDARQVFDSVQHPQLACLTALLLGYAENGDGHTALELFSRMKSRGFSPDSVTYIAALKACTALALDGDTQGSLERGRRIHLEIGSHMNHYVQNTLIDMYAKCGSMAEARSMFESIQMPDVVSWNVLVLGYADNGEGATALDLFSRMKSCGCIPNSVTYVGALKACIALAVNGGSSGSLERGRTIHSEIGCHLNRYVQCTLIDMYAKCGCMTDARLVFKDIRKPDVASWNALLLGYAENGEGLIALDLFSKLKGQANAGTYIAAIKACTSLAVNAEDSAKGDCLRRGREIHAELGSGQSLDHNVLCTLIDMYAKCGSMLDASRVFDSIQRPNVVSWNVLILGYAENGDGVLALDLFSRMKASGCAPDSVTFISALKACTSLPMSCLERAREIHGEIGNELNHHVQCTLIDVYANCSSMVEARQVFDSIEKPNVVSWTSLLLGYADNGEGRQALDLFSNMKSQGCAPNAVTYIALLKAIGLTGDLDLGRKLHSEMQEFRPHLVTCLVDFYAKCGSVAEARGVFDAHPRARDVSTWNALLAGYSSFDSSGSAFDIFEAMQDEGFRPNAVTLLSMLLCCSHGGLVQKARDYFEAMQAKYQVAPTAMHYGVMVDVLGRANQLHEAIPVVRRMPCNPTAVAWTALLAACRKLKNLDIGRLAFQSLVEIDKKDASAHVLMAHIYGSRGFLKEQERVKFLLQRLKPPI